MALLEEQLFQSSEGIDRMSVNKAWLIGKSIDLKQIEMTRSVPKK